MFCNNDADAIAKQMAQWQVEGEISGDDDIAPDGCFYLEAQADIQSALIKGGFPTNFDSSTPIALNYIASLHAKLTTLLYIQARRINLTVDGTDPTRGIWGNIRAKLAAISRGEPFGELKSPAGAVQMASFYTDTPCCGYMSICREL